MNYFFYIIIGILLFGFILELLTSLLNLKALDPEIPEEFRDTFDPERYRKSQDYTRENTRFSLIESSTGLLALILFITFGGFNYVDIAARNITPEGDHPILNGLVFAGLLSLITGAFSLPFSLYSTFVIEERYGFNKTTLKTFIMDRVKGMILGALIASAILSVILWFFEFAGDAAWLYCWGAVVVFTLFIQYISPVVIMPLFNKFTPLEQGELRDMILDYAERESFKLKGIFTMDGSKRTSKANAFFTGFGRYKRIVFFDNLTEKLSNSEILAVLAHEMGHFKLRHIFKLLVFSVLQTGLMFYILSLLLENSDLFQAFGMEHVSVYASLVFFGFIFTPVNMVTSVAVNAYSRKAEYEADDYSVRSTEAGEALISGLKKISAENLSNLTPHPVNVFFNYSHPPVLERIRTLKMASNN